jgi:hypothetical protein
MTTVVAALCTIAEVLRSEDARVDQAAPLPQ